MRHVHMVGRGMLLAAAAITLSSAAQAQVFTITGDHRDQIVTESRTLQDQALMPVGFSNSAPAGGRNAVFLFSLPTLAPGTTLVDANLDLYLTAKVNATFGITYNADLYALGIRNLPLSFSTGVFAGDYFAGALDTTDATLIQDNFVTRLPLDQTGFISTDASGDGALVTYLNAQYAANLVGPTSYLALRLNPDIAVGNASFFQFASGDASATSGQRPLLTLTAASAAPVPEPGVGVFLGATLLPLAAGMVRARRRRK